MWAGDTCHSGGPQGVFAGLAGTALGQLSHQARKMGGGGQVMGVQAEGILTNSDLALGVET